jgi:hypothetical protein
MRDLHNINAQFEVAKDIQKYLHDYSSQSIKISTARLKNAVNHWQLAVEMLKNSSSASSNKKGSACKKN